MNAPAKKKGRLLIVDDEADIREVLESTLENYAEVIVQAFDGQDAYEKIKANHFDAVLSDIKMPRMSGLELLSKLRSDGIMIPFVILTAYGDKPKTVEALKNGAMDFLDKPWDAKNLRGVITSALELGLEMSRWGSETEVVAGLEQVRKESADQAIDRLGRVAANMALEIMELRKKLEGKA